LAVGLVLSVLAAQAQTSRPNFSGTWKLDTAKSEIKHSKFPEQTWKIQAGRDKIQVNEVPQGGTEHSWECGTMGKECTVDDSGTQAKLSMFYNGPTLMEFRTRGEEVVRRSIKMSDDGKTLQVDLSYITPQKDAEKLVFVKVEDAPAAASASTTKP
jgi:hypothetical protein